MDDDPYTEVFTMAMLQPDDATREMLLLGKQIYQRALVLSDAIGLPINRVLTVTLFDLATETALRVTRSGLNPRKTAEDSFPSLVNSVENLLEKRGVLLSDKGNIERVHYVRNNAQHKAIIPDATTVNDCRTYARDFLHRLYHDVWGVDFERLSLVDAIQDDYAKQELAVAVDALASDDHVSAAIHAALAFNGAVKSAEQAVLGDSTFLDGWFLTLNHYDPDWDFPTQILQRKDQGEDQMRIFEKMKDLSVLLALGLNYSEIARLRRVTGWVWVNLKGELRFSPTFSDISVRDAEFVVAFCIRSVLQIEQAVGSLKAPYEMS